jgi:hypothetical protein
MLLLLTLLLLLLLPSLVACWPWLRKKPRQPLPLPPKQTSKSKPTQQPRQHPNETDEKCSEAYGADVVVVVAAAADGGDYGTCSWWWGGAGSRRGSGDNCMLLGIRTKKDEKAAVVWPMP